MVTRIGLVVKKWGFPLQNGDEKGSRRQKLVTRISLVAKNEYFSPKNGDENGFRRQKRAFFALKWVTRSKSNGSWHPLSRYFPHIINKNYLNSNNPLVATKQPL